jgi:DNA polymerase-3 subunit theta
VEKVIDKQQAASSACQSARKTWQAMPAGGCHRACGAATYRPGKKWQRTSPSGWAKKRRNMSGINISTRSKEDQDKIAVDLAASGVAYKERLNQPVVPEMVVREQPGELQEYFMERLRHYRQLSQQLPKASDPQYAEMG